MRRNYEFNHVLTKGGHLGVVQNFNAKDNRYSIRLFNNNGNVYLSEHEFKPFHNVSDLKYEFTEPNAPTCEPIDEQDMMKQDYENIKQLLECYQGSGDAVAIQKLQTILCKKLLKQRYEAVMDITQEMLQPSVQVPGEDDKTPISDRRLEERRKESQARMAEMKRLIQKKQEGAPTEADAEGAEDTEGAEDVSVSSESTTPPLPPLPLRDPARASESMQDIQGRQIAPTRHIQPLDFETDYKKMLKSLRKKAKQDKHILSQNKGIRTLNVKDYSIEWI